MMQMTTTELNYSRDYTVAIANSLIRGKQSMSLQESKLLYITISQVIKQDKDLKTYTTTIPELARFLNVSADNLYRDIKKICRDLMTRHIEIKQDSDSWELFQWVNACKYYNGTITIRLSDEIKPYLIALEKYYSQYLLDTLISFRSYYTSRLYQLCLCELNEKNRDEIEITFSIEELREFFQIDRNKYKNKRYDLIKYTVEVAKAELMTMTKAEILIDEIILNKAHRKGNPIESVTIKAIRK